MTDEERELLAAVRAWFRLQLDNSLRMDAKQSLHTPEFTRLRGALIADYDAHEP